jgi:hypothetical protein
MNTEMNINTLKEQRDHLLSHVWHDSKQPPQAIDDEVAWGIIELLDSLISESEDVKNVIYK